MTRTPGYAQHIDRELRRIFEHKRIIVVGGPVAGLTGLARQLVALGAERPFVIGSSMGLGSPPEPEEADWCSLELSAKSVNDSLRGYERRLLHPPDEVRARVDAWDPERKAIALGAIVLGELPTVCGRPRFGARPRDWIALEDKTRIDELWDALGVRRAPSEIVRGRQAGAFGRGGAAGPGRWHGLGRGCAGRGSRWSRESSTGCSSRATPKTPSSCSRRRWTAYG